MKAPILTLCLMTIILFSTDELKSQEITAFSSFWKVKYYQDDKEVDKKELETIMKSNPEADAYWQKSKSARNIAWIAFGAEVGFLTWAIIVKNSKSSVNNSSTVNEVVPVIGFIFSAFVYGGFTVSKYSLKKKAILSYNHGLSDDSSIEIRPASNGIGIVIVF